MHDWPNFIGFFSWEAAFGAGIVILALAIAYGMTRSANRNRSNDAVSEAATSEAYAHPDSYTENKERSFKDKLKP